MNSYAADFKLIVFYFYLTWDIGPCLKKNKKYLYDIWTLSDDVIETPEEGCEMRLCFYFI